MEDGGWFLKPLFLLLFKYTMGPNYKVGFDFLVQCKLDELKKMKKVYEHNKKLILDPVGKSLILKSIYIRAILNTILFAPILPSFDQNLLDFDPLSLKRAVIKT